MFVCFLCLILVVVLIVGLVYVEMNFNCIVSFVMFLNMVVGEDIKCEISFEIIDVMVDGMILVYIDSFFEVFGCVDIIDFVNLKFFGNIVLSGELIFVVVIGVIVYVGVNIFESYIVLFGMLKVIDVVIGVELVFCDLGG